MSEQELAIHAAHLQYGDRWEQMTAAFLIFCRAQGIDTEAHGLFLAEIASHLCDLVEHEGDKGVCDE